MTSNKRVVVIGAGLAGVRLAERLGQSAVEDKADLSPRRIDRRQGHTGNARRRQIDNKQPRLPPRRGRGDDRELRAIPVEDRKLRAGQAVG